ncbi:cob(I)yrinic acid a,c-diamide adenosyltransferase [Candidatus Microgenomates bacterium]|nr:cob(I)yrinic acid a,c-diamide adenosyltransferase [Candidatus Microgenomates bacterium]
MLKIYTRTGDKGQTSLFGGKRVAKDDIRVEAYGTVDELNSAIGMIIAEISNIKYQISNIKKELTKIQHDLFEIGSMLASASIKRSTLDAKRLGNRAIDFELLIDKLTKELPELHNFILAGGGGAGSLLHFARTICRRAERRVVSLSKKEKVALEILIYLNRLSDLLFTMARFVNFKEKRKEIIWKKNG